MVLGIITSVAACPAIVGTTEAVRQGQRQNAKERHRGQRSNLVASCLKVSRHDKAINGRLIVLRNNKLYVAAPEAEDMEVRLSHLFTGYFLPFPEQDWGRRGEGMVSTVSDDPPQLNWIYMDRETYEVKYGLRVDAEPHLVGPWDWTKIDRRITLEGWEGFVAVEEQPDEWALYFDLDDDGLKSKLGDRRAVEIVLSRREKRKGKDDEE